MTHSKVLDSALDSVRLPIEHFIATGFYDAMYLREQGPGDMPEFVVRSAVRAVAKELKRPFIRLHEVWSRSTSCRNPKTGEWEYKKYDAPEWHGGYFEVPKRKRLAPLVAPFLLVEPTDRWTGKVNTWQPIAKDEHPAISAHEYTTLWAFSIRDKAMWDQFYHDLMHDPQLRRARGLT